MNQSDQTTPRDPLREQVMRADLRNLIRTAVNAGVYATSGLNTQSGYDAQLALDRIIERVRRG